MYMDTENGLRLGENLIIDWFIQLTAAIMYISTVYIIIRIYIIHVYIYVPVCNWRQ